MQILLIYLLKATVGSGILLLYYWIALRNKRFHHYNRFYLLMSVALSLILPFLNIELWQFSSSNRQVIDLMNVVAVNNTEVTIGKDTNSFSWNYFIPVLYACVTVSMLTALAGSIYKLYRYRRMYPVERLGKVVFINTDLQEAPFSFFNNLFWKKDIDITDATGRQIFKHELTHIEQKHSWDKLFVRLTALVLWMNPFYWLIQKELGIIHEFIADEKAIENRSAEAFARLLLQSQWGNNIFSPAQSFNYSPIKRRLVMLTTSSKTSYSYVRRIMILPLLAITVLLFAFKMKENKQLYAIHTNAPFTLIVDAGHGGSDAGAMGINDIKEKDINLLIARKIQELAPEYGITVKMTRTEDVAVDLKTRVDVAETAHPDAFVSIHVSTTSEKQTNRNEIDVFIPRNESSNNYAQSRLLGSSLLQSAKKDFPVNLTLLQRKGEGIYVIDKNSYPAVMIECGYLNNTENLKQFNDKVKTEQLARDMLQGVVTFANAALQTINTTIADTSGKTPLYFVDGKETAAIDVNKIDAGKIESINVLKDADAIKKYGEKGKNGVVLITLKKAGNNQTSTYMQRQIVQDSNAVNAAKMTLKVIDGKIATDEDLEKIDANVIESVTVLKGVDAVNKYGEKGSNGVIEIRTKNGKKETAPRASFSSPVIVEDKDDSTVDFTGNTGLRAQIAFKKDTSDKYEKVFQSAQTPPSFPGGNDAWQKYLQRNLKFDVPIEHKAPTGTYTAIVSFTVDTDGNLLNVKTEKDPGYGTGAEAVRVIQRGPKWIPAQQNGHIVTAETKQAITFSVEEN